MVIGSLETVPNGLEKSNPMGTAVNQRKNRDGPNNSIIEIGQKTQKKREDLLSLNPPSNTDVKNSQSVEIMIIKCSKLV